MDARALREWTPESVDGQCRAPYRAWESAHRARYHAVLAARGVALTRPWVVEDRRELLPSGFADQALERMPAGGWHIHSRSAKSSQTLALGFFGPAVAGDEAAWAGLASALLPAGIDPGRALARPRFEHAMRRQDLRRDRPALFVLVHDPDNPYFRSTGDWPGWPVALEDALGPPLSNEIGFSAVTWNELVPRVLDRPELVEWARDLHAIDPAAGDPA